MALYECSTDYRDPTRNYTNLPLDWIKMNNMSDKIDSFKSVCAKEGQDGYEMAAAIEDAKISNQAGSASVQGWVIGVIVGMVVLALLIVIGVVYCAIRKRGSQELEEQFYAYAERQ